MVMFVGFSCFPAFAARLRRICKMLDNFPPIMRPNQAAEALCLSVQRLAKLRFEGEGPEFYRAGRSILYSRQSLETWLAKRRFVSTSDPGLNQAA
jgi:hypothetical protein